MRCLQDNLHILPPNCKTEVVKFTEIQAQNSYLHPNIMKACQDVVDENCGEEDKARNGAMVIRCLERHLVENPPGSPNTMNSKCRKVVESWQILSIKDFHFSF